MRRTWYRIFDSNPNGCIEIAPEEARDWNDRGWGIFWSVNEIAPGAARTKENVVKVNSWYLEIDHGSKLDQWGIIRSFITPSLVVESKRGFHVYFHAKDGTIDHWDAIVAKRLIHYYGADPNVKDISRVLRVPGFYHLKNPNAPFMVRTVFEYDVAYSEMELMRYFPLPPEPQKLKPARRESKELLRGGGSRDLWDRIFRMDCEEALLRLSGSGFVNHEEYSFKPLHNGNFNIIVNGHMTGCWIDQDKRIGSHSGGGPTIWNWLKWFGYTNSQIAKIMREVFPELWENERKTG